MGILSGEATLFIFLIMGQLLEERICSFRSKFFPLRVALFLEWLSCPGRQIGNLINCLPLQNGGQTCWCTHTPKPQCVNEVYHEPEAADA